MVSIREMGSFPVVLPPHVTLSAVAEPPPPKLPTAQRWCDVNWKPPSVPSSQRDVTLPRHPATSPCHITHLKSPQKWRERRNRDLGSSESVFEVVFDARLAPSANHASLREKGQNGNPLSSAGLQQSFRLKSARR